MVASAVASAKRLSFGPVEGGGSCHVARDEANWPPGCQEGEGTSVAGKSVGGGEVIGEGIGEADEEAGEFGAVVGGPGAGEFFKGGALVALGVGDEGAAGGGE